MRCLRPLVETFFSFQIIAKNYRSREVQVSTVRGVEEKELRWRQKLLDKTRQYKFQITAISTPIYQHQQLISWLLSDNDDNDHEYSRSKLIIINNFLWKHLKAFVFISFISSWLLRSTGNSSRGWSRSETNAEAKIGAWWGSSHRDVN